MIKPVLDELESRIVLECSRDVASFQAQFARFSTERTMSQDTATDNVNPTNLTGILPRTTAIPVITPRVNRYRSYQDKSVSSLAEIQPSVNDNTRKVYKYFSRNIWTLSPNLSGKKLLIE